jgi:DNA-binding protein H-NS
MTEKNYIFTALQEMLSKQERVIKAQAVFNDAATKKILEMQKDIDNLREIIGDQQARLRRFTAN